MSNEGFASKEEISLWHVYETTFKKPLPPYLHADLAYHLNQGIKLQNMEYAIRNSDGSAKDVMESVRRCYQNQDMTEPLRKDESVQ